MKEHRTKKDLQRCKKCIYHNNEGGRITCDFILKRLEPRGCEAGLKCTRFESGARKKSKKYIDENARSAMKAESDSRNEMIAYKGEALKRMRVGGRK